MKKFLLSTAALVSLTIAAPAFAADLPVKAPPPVLPALYNWSGIYVGVEGGAIMGQRTEWRFLDASATTGVGPLTTTGICDGRGFLLFSPTTPLTTGADKIPVPGTIGTTAGTVVTTNSTPGFPAGAGTCADVGHPLHGGFVGGEAGFNWQFDRWVVGIEGDGQWSELEEALTCAVPFQGFTCGNKIRNFETVRGRIGYAFGPRGDFLVFITGGWATADVRVFEGELFEPFTTFTSSRRHDGWTFGGGAEYGITPWLSVKGEVLYVNLAGDDHCFGNCGVVGTATATATAFATAGQTVRFVTGPVPAHVREDFIAARMALNWRFGWVGKGKAPLAVMAKY
jgi:opacity protein-like surface antigen